MMEKIKKQLPENLVLVLICAVDESVDLELIPGKCPKSIIV